MPMYTPEEQWNAYMLAFATDIAAERERLLQQSVSDDVTFTNPGGSGKSCAALAAHIADFRTKMPGMYFDTDKIYVTHGELLAVWSMYRPDHTKIVTGYNFVRLDDGGRFSYMAGFF